MRLKKVGRTCLHVSASLALLWAVPAMADDTTSTGQLSVRIGLLSGNFSIGDNANKQSETINVPETLDADYDFFSSNRRSFFLRGTMAYDTSQARVAYMFFGAGARFYLMGNAMTYDRSDTEGNRVS